MSREIDRNKQENKCRNGIIVDKEKGVPWRWAMKAFEPLLLFPNSLEAKIKQRK